jgi:hypothetical protein
MIQPLKFAQSVPGALIDDAKRRRILESFL